MVCTEFATSRRVVSRFFRLVETRHQLVANPIHTADATQLDCWLASAVCTGRNSYLGRCPKIKLWEWLLQVRCPSCCLTKTLSKQWKRQCSWQVQNVNLQRINVISRSRRQTCHRNISEASDVTYPRCQRSCQSADKFSHRRLAVTLLPTAVTKSAAATQTNRVSEISANSRLTNSLERNSNLIFRYR